MSVVSLSGQVFVKNILSIDLEMLKMKYNKSIVIKEKNKDFNGDKKNDILFEIKDVSVHGNSEHELYLSGTKYIIHMDLRLNPKSENGIDIKYIKSKNGDYYNIIGYDGNTFGGNHFYAGNQVITILSFYNNKIEVVNSEYPEICNSEISNIQIDYDNAYKNGATDLFRYKYDILYSKIYMKEFNIMNEIKTNKTLVDLEICSALDYYIFVTNKIEIGKINKAVEQAGGADK